MYSYITSYPKLLYHVVISELHLYIQWFGQLFGFYGISNLCWLFNAKCIFMQRVNSILN